ncbi:uncharacterized protein LOC108199243 isoform X2 [Daucus carota subsp. sativus]|uniref:uncharacterized protein LOC108199243 isoform X2 n=1 Tax=Daucus carota subsp. sativus TaxID=79200 RepID=UPI0007F02FE6|nr:PREDICTED: trithorax group protein osa-like isoform X2 [Daucus carota subsp. sativus]
MGFDNECIVNIQSLAGEYFCPVCRTLVYPNEALQSQCTHLYCKLCLTYIVGTTKACPYDGYLVTEKDSKPLVESDKALAERIGKTPVHCLFHRSGCSWQGPLSECTSHCSGCSFGNSPVVCNRCGVQIIHRQVQEHAQNCAGANPHVQQTAENPKDAATAVAVTTTNSSQATSQPVVSASQALVPQTVTAPPATQDSNPHVHTIATSAAMSTEQWYPQHFQQYQQQYPGYDPYQQYYPYQQPAQQVQQHVPYAGQPQVYAQPPTGMQGHHQPLPQVQGQGPAQTQPQPQGPPQAQSFVQNQVNSQQQQSHIQVHTQTAAPGQIPPQQPYPQAQPHPPPNSMQPPAQQNIQAPYQQTQFQGHSVQLQIQPQPHSNPQPVLQSQPQSHPYPPSQQPAPSVVPGYQSHHPVQPQQQILPAPQHYPMPMHPSSGSFPPAAQFPQQPPHLRPPPTNPSLPNQQQANLMQSQSQIQGVPPAQHPHIYPQTPQQGYIGHQRPAGQPMQQPYQQYGQPPFPSQASGSVQGPFHQIPFGQQPMQTQSQAQGPTQLQQSAVARPPPQMHGSVQAHGMPPQQPPSYGGRPIAPNQTATSHPFAQSGGAFGGAPHSRPLPSSSVQQSEHQIFEGGIANQQQVPSGQQFSQSDREIKHIMGEGNAAPQGGSALNKTVGNDISGPEEDSVRAKAQDSEIRGKSGDEEHNITTEGEKKGTRSQVAEAEVDALKTGSSEPSLEKTGKEKTGTLNEMDGSVFAVKDSTSRQTEAFVGHKKDNTNVLANENKSSHGQVSQQGLAIGEYAGFHDKGLPNSSNQAQLTDQGRYQMPSGTYGPPSQQQRHTMPSNSQSGPYVGAPPNALPGQGPAHLKPQGPGLSGPLHQSLHPSEHFHQSGSSQSHESFQGVQRGQYYQNNPPQPPFSRTNKAEPTGPLHGSDNAGPLQNQRLHHLEGRYPDPNVSGSFDRGLYEQTLANENRVPGAALGLHAKNVNDDHMKQFRTGPAGRNSQGEYEQALKQFPKPANIGNGSIRAGPGFGVDHLPPRSPGREFHGIPSRGFGAQSGGPHNQPGLDNVHGWGSHAVNEGPRSFDISSDPVGKTFRDHFRSGDMAGQDFIPNHMRRGELFGPRNVPSHIRAVEGFGTFSDPRMGELNGHGGFPYGESFAGNKLNHPRLGEPGFRSSFSLHEFPRPGGFYEGNLESIDRFRKRMPASMGWCRICKVNCDTVDGLDLHSQTPEHQQRTMEMVMSIKQNAKRQKTSKDQSFVEEGIRSRNAGNRGRGKKV